ncbi:MAG: SDR family NAD(P)-dependent oxidoreductase [Candidatus Binatia bacterium]
MTQSQKPQNPTDRRVAIVTGSSRGIGRGCALELAKRGFDVVVCARTLHEGQAFEHSSTVKQSNTSPLPGSLEKTAREIEALGARALPVKLDLRDPNDVHALVDRTMKEWGRIDVLVNNARYIGPGHMDPFLDTPIELFDAQLECNVLSPLLLIQRVAPIMIRQGGGVIIDVTSAAGSKETPHDIGSGGWGLGYSISKAAFNRIAAGLAKELRRHNIAVINLEPGFVATERLATDMGPFGFDASKGLGVEIPGIVCAYLAAHPTPMSFSGRDVDAPSFAVDAGLVDGTKLPAPYGSSHWGLPGRGAVI